MTKVQMQWPNLFWDIGINHATIQVHDSKDQAFCYSETCDDHSILPNGESSRPANCVSSKISTKV